MFGCLCVQNVHRHWLELVVPLHHGQRTSRSFLEDLISLGCFCRTVNEVSNKSFHRHPDAMCNALLQRRNLKENFLDACEVGEERDIAFYLLKGSNFASDPFLIRA